MLKPPKPLVVSVFMITFAVGKLFEAPSRATWRGVRSALFMFSSSFWHGKTFFLISVNKFGSLKLIVYICGVIRK
jgi:hypothetical protein